MANIDTELQTISEAIYGRDMRSAIHDAIEKVNIESTSTAAAIGSVMETSYTTGTIGDGWSDFTGSYTLEKVGNLVTFSIDIHVQDSRSGFNPPDSGTELFTLPNGFKPDTSYPDMKYAINPCITNSSGYFPYLTISTWGGQVFIYNMYSEVIGTQTDFVVSGTYSVASVPSNSSEDVPVIVTP